jgi:tetratricopeptide (TPR) repeat protein
MILDEGLARHPDSASGYVVLGRVLADMQIGDEAEVAFRQVLSLDGGNLVALRWLGDLARQAGRNHEATTYYRELLTRNPSNEEVRDLVEIVERDAGGVAPPPDGQAETTEPDSGDVAWQDPVEEPAEVGGYAPADIVDQTGMSDSELSPLSAAPGQTGDGEAAEVEFGLLEISALPDEDEAHATSAEAAPPETESAGTASSIAAPAEDGLVVDSTGDELDDALLQLNETVRNDEASPLELHLLDPSFADEDSGEVDVNLRIDEEAAPVANDFADDEFIADLISASTESTPDHPDMLDPAEDAPSLTLSDAAADHSAASGAAEPTWNESELVESQSDDAQAEYEAPASAALWSGAPDRYEDADVASGTFESISEAGDIEEMEAENVDLDVVELEVAGDASGETESVESSGGTARGGATSEVDAVIREPGLLDRLDSFAADFADDAIGGAEESDQPDTAPTGADAVAAAAVPAAAEAGPVTETLAELYRAQGFHERAAEVYRALLRQRPFDLRLSAKLSEAEADAAAAAAGRSASFSGAIDDEATGEVWLRGVGAPWDAGLEDRADSASPYGWTPEPEETAPGAPIASYLRDLVGWKTAGNRRAEPQSPPPSGPPKAPSWDAAGEPWAAPAAPAGWGTSGDAEVVDPWGEPGSAAPDASPGGSASPAVPEPPAAGADGEEASAEPADPWLQDTAAQPAESTADPWGSTPAEAAAAPDQGASGRAAPEPAAPPPESAAAGDDDREDEDLAMFRSWLQSLKK